MKLEFAELLGNVNYNIDVREDYSGRGMYGRTTAGVVVEDLSEFLSAVGEAIEYGDEDEIAMIAEELQKGVSTDSMGRSMIIY
jgi:hypothetical protein